MSLRRLYNFAIPESFAHNPLAIHPMFIELGAETAYATKPFGASDAWSMDELLDTVPSTMFNRPFGLWSKVDQPFVGDAVVGTEKIHSEMRGFESIDLLLKYVPDFVTATRKRTDRIHELGASASVYAAPESDDPVVVERAINFVKECGFDEVVFDAIPVVSATPARLRLPRQLIDAGIKVKLEPIAPVHPDSFGWHGGEYACMVLWSTFDYRESHTGGAYFGSKSNGVYRDNEIEILIQGGNPSPPSARVPLAAKYAGRPVCCELDGNTMEEIASMGSAQ